MFWARWIQLTTNSNFDININYYYGNITQQPILSRLPWELSIMAKVPSTNATFYATRPWSFEASYHQSFSIAFFNYCIAEIFVVHYFHWFCAKIGKREFSHLLKYKQDSLCVFWTGWRIYEPANMFWGRSARKMNHAKISAFTVHKYVRMCVIIVMDK